MPVHVVQHEEEEADQHEGHGRDHACRSGSTGLCVGGRGRAGMGEDAGRTHRVCWDRHTAGQTPRPDRLAPSCLTLALPRALAPHLCPSKLPLTSPLPPFSILRLRLESYPRTDPAPRRSHSTEEGRPKRTSHRTHATRGCA